MVQKRRNLSCFLAALGCASALFALPVAASAAVVAFAPPGAGQGGLAVGFDAAGSLRAASCAAVGCSIDHGTELAFPAELRPAIPSTQFSVVGIGAGHRAIVVAVSDAHSGRSWHAVVVAPLGGGEPSVIFSGLTGFVEGEDGTRRGKSVEISAPDENGVRRIVVGDVQEDLSLCGRPALLAPQLLANTDLKLHPAKVQRLSVEEREHARHVTAVRADASQPATGASLLRAVAATSAVGSPGALTDGNPETTWAENRGGAGRGEFVLMNMPPEVPLSGLDLLVRPANSKPENGVAPREFWLATNKDLTLVTMPEDAWKFPGAHYVIKLDPPLQGDCLALVTESAFDENPHARVTFAELSARTEFDSATVPALVAALAGGGERAQGAEALLRVMGQPAFDAVAQAFEGLDEGGRRVALDLLDQAPCETSLPAYLLVFSGESQAQQIHARDHIRRCGKAAAPFLADAARKARGAQQLELLAELTLADAAQCVDVIVSLLDVDSRSRRAALRIALARASLVSASKPRVLAVLADPKSSERLVVEVLRSLGDRITDFQPEAGAAVARLSLPSASFWSRFLLLEPSAELAVKDAGLRQSLARELLTDPDPRFRAQALSVLKDPADFAPQLSKALTDSDVRVREAAVRASAALPDAAPALAQRLTDDPWPLVRIAAADALADSSALRTAEPALARAIEDESPHVRAHVLLALGAHHALAEVPKIRERLADKEEHPLVRAAAAQALAALCDTSSVAALTGYAVKLADPMADANEHMLGAASLLALSDLRPADLEARLQPLRVKGAPVQARQAADAVLRRSGGACGGAAPPKKPGKSRVPAS
ncbi:MAG TPA: HEAT repeat domain-containing protein [Polyangiaceae bacterium]|nr:HEAT repeat domain-containing protein [Polyangiaceae bacterium]